VTPIQKIPLTH